MMAKKTKPKTKAARPKPMSPKAGYKKNKYGEGGKLKKK